jgi:site-specific DNA-methyltransferase (adenine-specific)
MPEAHRVLKPSGSLWLFGSMRFLIGHWPDPKQWRMVQDIVWEKQNGTGFQNDRFRRVHEHVVQFVHADAKWADVYHQPQFTMDAVAKQVRRKTKPPHTGDIGAGHYVSHDGGPRLMRSVQRVANMHGAAIHETQKPEGIITPLVLFSCPPDGLVLDPFAGSGTTGVVCALNTRHFVGIEIRQDMAALATQRIEATERAALFGDAG